MKFRYFILNGGARRAYLKSEKKEMAQRIALHKALLKDRDDIQSYRPSRDGGVASMVFKEGKQPAGFVRASKKLSKEEVRPHGKSKEAKSWRDLLKSLAVSEDCQAVLCKELGLPVFVPGANSSSRTGMSMYSSRSGHVGQRVYVEVPEETGGPFEPSGDMREVEAWMFEKACSEAEGYDYGKVYVLPSRARS